MSAENAEVEILDESNPDNNMYGCASCPLCGSRHRWPRQDGVLVCDHCGYHCRWARKALEETP